LTWREYTVPATEFPFSDEENLTDMVWANAERFGGRGELSSAGWTAPGWT